MTGSSDLAANLTDPAIFDIYFNAFPKPLLIYDSGSVVIKANKAGIGILGFDPAGLHNRDLALRLSTCSDAEKYKDVVTGQVLEKGEISDFTFRIMTAEGKEKYFACSSGPVKQNSRITGAVSIWHDISRKKRPDSYPDKTRPGKKRPLLQKLKEMASALSRKSTDLENKDRQLKQQSDVFEKVFSNTHFLIVLLNSRFRIIRVNSRFAEINGLPPDKFPGKNYFDLYPDSRNRKIFSRVVREGKPFAVYSQLYNHGTTSPLAGKYWDWSLNPFKDENGNVNGLVLILLDVSQRKKAETDLVEAKRLSDIGALAATVGHELRNPLGVILATVYNIKHEFKDEKLSRRLDKIERKIAESEKIINNLLSYARIKPPIRKKIHIYGLLSECVSDTENQKSKGNINIKRDFDILKDHVLALDPFQIREVLLNILNNACQALSGKNGKITVSGFIEQPFLGIDIRDNGQGINPGDLNRIYDPFFTRKSKGTGLGLTICRDMISLHNGKIKINSRTGKGTRVRILLPLKSGTVIQ